MLKQVLTDIGFSSKEAAVYLISLELGPQPASIIAKHADINRSTTYVILTSLIKKGLISSFNKADIKYFSAQEPQALLQYIKRHTEELEKYKKEIEANLKEFQHLVNPYSERPKVKFFEGLEGIKSVYEDTLKQEEEIVAFESIKAMPEEAKQYIFEEYIPKRIEKNIFAKAIVIESKQAKEFKKEDKKSLRQTKLVQGKGLDIEINIYGNKIAFMAYHQAKYTGIIIENKAIANAMRFIFRLSWDSLH